MYAIIYRRWQVRKEWKRKRKRETNQLNTFLIIYSLVSMHVCNVMWNDFKKKRDWTTRKEYNEVFVTDWNIVSNRIARMTK